MPRSPALFYFNTMFFEIQGRTKTLDLKDTALRILNLRKDSGLSRAKLSELSGVPMQFTLPGFKSPFSDFP